MSPSEPCFAMRAVLECGWNLFHRKGFSTDPAEIAVNNRFLDHLSQAGINWLIVFWTNSAGFQEHWEDAAAAAHARGIRVARAIYGFGGGGPEHGMAEPDAPEALLTASRRGPRTALCPHDARARAWMAGILPQRLAPGIDGLLIEPAREIGRNCLCERCRALRPYEWDALVRDTCSTTGCSAGASGRHARTRCP